MSLGVYPEVSLKEARLAALEARQLVAEGRDPVRERSGKGECVARYCVREVAGEWLAGQEGRWTAAHAAKVRSRLERIVFPALGDREVGEVGRATFCCCAVRRRAAFPRTWGMSFSGC